MDGKRVLIKVDVTDEGCGCFDGTTLAEDRTQWPVLRYLRVPLYGWDLLTKRDYKCLKKDPNRCNL